MPEWETLSTIGFGATTLLLGVLSYRLQRRAGEAEAKLKELELHAATVQAERAQRAILEPYLQPDPGPRSFVLAVRNLGESTAYNVVVLADHDTQRLRHLTTFSSIVPGGLQTFVFTNHDWQVLGGSMLGLQLQWDDGSGHHEELASATLRR